MLILKPKCSGYSWKLRTFACAGLLSFASVAGCGGPDQLLSAEKGKSKEVGGYGQNSPFSMIPNPLRNWLALGNEQDVNMDSQLSEFIFRQATSEEVGFQEIFSPNKGQKVTLSANLELNDTAFWINEIIQSSEAQVNGRTISFSWRTERSGDIGTLSLFLGNLAVVGAQVKAQWNGKELIDFSQGNIPSLLLKNFESFTQQGHKVTLPVEAHKLTTEMARAAIASDLNFHPSRVSLPIKTYVATNGKIIPTFSANVESDSSLLGRAPAYPLEVIIDARDGRLLEQRALKIHLDGQGLVYPENILVNQSQGTQTVKLGNLLEPGNKLSSNLFRVVTCGQKEPGNCSQQAIASSPGDFKSYTFEDPRYDEVVAHYTLSRAMDWYRALMAFKPNPTTAWGSGYPGARNDFGLNDKFGIEVNVRAMTKSSSTYLGLSNAAYLPSTLKEGARPQIVIGTGWEPGMPDEAKYPLRYLGKDSDVVMHEFGHHMMFRALRDVRGEGLPIHEGFADYFTYAITGNPLLGESIVPNNRASLRAGNKSGNVADYVQAKGHIAGELLSSALWKIRGQLGPWRGSVFAFDKIVWEAVDLLKADADYYDTIAALAKSIDNFAVIEKKNGKDLKEKMFKVFFEYGYLAEPNGDGSLPFQAPRYLTATNQTQRTIEDDSKTSLAGGGGENKKAWYECGSVAARNASPGASWLWVFLILAPLLAPHTTPVAQKIRKKISGR